MKLLERATLTQRQIHQSLGKRIHKVIIVTVAAAAIVVFSRPSTLRHLIRIEKNRVDFGMCAVRLPLPLQTTGSTYSIVWLDAYNTFIALTHTCAPKCSCMHAAYLLVVIIHRNRFELRLSTVFSTSFYSHVGFSRRTEFELHFLRFAINGNGIYADSNFVGLKAQANRTDENEQKRSKCI